MATEGVLLILLQQTSKTGHGNPSSVDHSGKLIKEYLLICPTELESQKTFWTSQNCFCLAHLWISGLQDS